MKKVLIGLFAFLIIAIVAFVLVTNHKNLSVLNPLVEQPTPKPLLVYSFENLKKTKFAPTKITFGRKIGEDATSIRQMFYFEVPETPGSSKFLKVSGLANVPKESGNYPVILMFRGFIPEETFVSGAGTEPSAQVFVHNGFITLAPDFLGFGESAKPAKDSFENRFQTYTTALSLLASLSNLNSGLSASYSGTITADSSKIGIWGHSNGGHITLSALAISGVTYPTVLWAPVSKSFPYSILYYTDESDDQGKSLRKVLSNFEELYNTDDFSPERYYKWIKAPIEINQGTADIEVPYWWSEDLVSVLKKNGNDVTYLTYPGADHNMRPTASWNEAVTASAVFYQKEFGK